MSEMEKMNEMNEQEIEVVNDQELEDVSGGKAYTNAQLHNLRYYVTKTVCNVVTYDNDPTSCLTMRVTPGGAVIPGVGWKNGQPILVHGSYREKGWYLAFDKKTKKYGYVNPNYVR